MNINYIKISLFKFIEKNMFWPFLGEYKINVDINLVYTYLFMYLNTSSSNT